MLSAIQSEKDNDVRYAIIQSLSYIQDAKALPDLEFVVNNDSGQTSRGKLLKDAAAEAIKRIKEAQAYLSEWTDRY